VALPLLKFWLSNEDGRPLLNIFDIFLMLVGVAALMFEVVLLPNCEKSVMVLL
jgi:hypothetical protein